MIIYILSKYRMKDDEFGDTEPQIVAVTKSQELAERWLKTTSYIRGDMHGYLTMDTRHAEGIVSSAEEVEKRRAQEYEKGFCNATEV